MSIAGELKLKLVVDTGRVTAVDIASTRPRMARLLLGKTVSAALPLLPRLFTVCGAAQRLAGDAAVATAQGRQYSATPIERLTLLCEATQEHLWRLLLDWPRLLGQTQMQSEFSAWFRRLGLVAKSGRWPDWGDSFADFVASQVLGMRLEAWAQLEIFVPAHGGESLADRIWRALPENRSENHSVWLPQASATTLGQALANLGSEDFERRPEWQGAPAETGSLARWHSHPALVEALSHYGCSGRSRLLARMMDLAQCARYIAAGVNDAATAPIDACCLEPGAGLARVETARGTLLHRVRLEEQRVAEYNVVAPTEWNFHPRGAFASMLLGSLATDVEVLHREAAILALALDPCVPYQIEVQHA
jgi:Ni,Fe-hydrogenase I large subunit